MGRQQILDALSRKVIEGDEEGCEKVAHEALLARIDAHDAIMKGCAIGMTAVAEKYDRREIFIPDLLLSASAMYKALGVLKPHWKVEVSTLPGIVVIGVVEGDIHDIGKNIVRTLIEATGFVVYDLGLDVSPERFVDKAKEIDGNVIAASTLMSTTIPAMTSTIRRLEVSGIRDKVKLIIGGAATSQVLADKVGADAWAENATSATETIRRLVGEVRKG